MKIDVTLDATGCFCPMPMLKTIQKVKDMKVGEVIEVHATDMGIKPDMMNWCKLTGNEFLKCEEEGSLYKVFIKKAAP